VNELPRSLRKFRVDRSAMDGTAVVRVLNCLVSVRYEISLSLHADKDTVTACIW